jgi:hypothetical protein
MNEIIRCKQLHKALTKVLSHAYRNDLVGFPENPTKNSILKWIKNYQALNYNLYYTSQLNFDLYNLKGLLKKSGVTDKVVRMAYGLILSEDVVNG